MSLQQFLAVSAPPVTESEWDAFLIPSLDIVDTTETLVKAHLDLDALEMLEATVDAFQQCEDNESVSAVLSSILMRHGFDVSLESGEEAEKGLVQKLADAAISIVKAIQDAFVEYVKLMFDRLEDLRNRAYAFYNKIKDLDGIFDKSIILLGQACAPLFDGRNFSHTLLKRNVAKDYLDILTVVVQHYEKDNPPPYDEVVAEADKNASGLLSNRGVAGDPAKALIPTEIIDGVSDLVVDLDKVIRTRQSFGGCAKQMAKDLKELEGVSENSHLTKEDIANLKNGPKAMNYAGKMALQLVIRVETARLVAYTAFAKNIKAGVIRGD